MQVSTSIEISKPREEVWSTITDIRNSSDVISSIISVEVLEMPESGINGLRWKETRKMFGKEASEVMWVTESKQNEYYCTRAESHGSIYITRLSLNEADAQPQTVLSKLLSFLMSGFIQKSIYKELNKDLNDIKNHVEQG